MSTDGCNIIEHYQKAIKKARTDETKLLHCIGKLDALPITIDHLQRTGVGKTINSLRKYNGAVGDAAKVLVAKWKNMVASGEVTSSSPEKQHNDYNLHTVESENTSKQGIKVKDKEMEVTRNGKYGEEKRHSEKLRDTHHREEKKHSHSQKDSNHREEKELLNNQKNSHHREEKHKESNHREEKRHSDTQRDSNHRFRENHSKQNNHHESKSNSSSSSKSNDKDKEKKSHKSSTRHEEKPSSSSSKPSSSKKSREEESSSSKSHKKDVSELSQLSGSSAASSSSKRNGETVAEKNQPKTKKTKLIANDGIEIDSSMGASFSDALGMCGIGGSTKKTKKLQKLIESKSIAETPHHSKSVAEKQNNSPPPIPDLLPEALKTSPKTKLDLSLNLPIAPPVRISDNYKPSPINQNVMNCIYPSSAPDKLTTANFDTTIQFNAKTMRTKVYSGVKSGALLQVPTLFDICIRVLQKNIDALEYTGGVPFDVLRPVLERTTPQQLLNFEDFNAYLLEDTDVLWQQHVGRHFRGQKRQEGETWREMFLRCEDEKERRLSILTKNIQLSQKQSALPIKKTRLAYVDNVVKPPRNIKRKQELYGTNDKIVASPAARVAALSAVSHNTVVAGDPRLKIGRDLAAAAAANNNSIRIKKAPLMAKTLQFIKKTYKR